MTEVTLRATRNLENGTTRGSQVRVIRNTVGYSWTAPDTGVGRVGTGSRPLSHVYVEPFEGTTLESLRSLTD